MEWLRRMENISKDFITEDYIIQTNEKDWEKRYIKCERSLSLKREWLEIKKLNKIIRKLKVKIENSTNDNTNLSTELRSLEKVFIKREKEFITRWTDHFNFCQSCLLVYEKNEFLSFMLDRYMVYILDIFEENKNNLTHAINSIENQLDNGIKKSIDHYIENNFEEEFRKADYKRLITSREFFLGFNMHSVIEYYFEKVLELINSKNPKNYLRLYELLKKINGDEKEFEYLQLNIALAVLVFYIQYKIDSIKNLIQKYLESRTQNINDLIDNILKIYIDYFCFSSKEEDDFLEEVDKKKGSLIYIAKKLIEKKPDKLKKIYNEETYDKSEFSSNIHYLLCKYNTYWVPITLTPPNKKSFDLFVTLEDAEVIYFILAKYILYVLANEALEKNGFKILIKNLIEIEDITDLKDITKLSLEDIPLAEKIEKNIKQIPEQDLYPSEIDEKLKELIWESINKELRNRLDGIFNNIFQNLFKSEVIGNFPKVYPVQYVLIFFKRLKNIEKEDNQFYDYLLDLVPESNKFKQALKKKQKIGEEDAKKLQFKMKTFIEHVFGKHRKSIRDKELFKYNNINKYVNDELYNEIIKFKNKKQERGDLQKATQLNRKIFFAIFNDLDFNINSVINDKKVELKLREEDQKKQNFNYNSEQEDDYNKNDEYLAALDIIAEYEKDKKSGIPLCIELLVILLKNRYEHSINKNKKYKYTSFVIKESKDIQTKLKRGTQYRNILRKLSEFVEQTDSKKLNNIYYISRPEKFKKVVEEYEKIYSSIIKDSGNSISTSTLEKLESILNYLKGLIEQKNKAL